MNEQTWQERLKGTVAAVLADIMSRGIFDDDTVRVDKDKMGLLFYAIDEALAHECTHDE